MTPRLAPIPAETLLAGQQRVLELVVRNAPVAETLQAIAAFAEECVPEMMASILIHSPGEGCLRKGGYGRIDPAFADIVDGLVPGPNMGSCGTCAHILERVISDDVFTDPLWAGFHELCTTFGIRSAWSSPLLSARDGALLGVFGMYYGTDGTPTPTDLQIADQFTSLATLALERYREDAEQRFRAQHDPLTGLGNRHMLGTEGPALIEAALAGGTPLSVAFVDLDSFKSFNDTYGHIRGDELLAAIASVMRSALPPDTMIVRTGGDEFVLILPTGIAEAAAAVEELRRALAGDVRPNDVPVAVRFACGLVELGPDADALDALVYFADEAAHDAKAAGGDHTVVVGTLQSQDYQRRRETLAVLANALTAGTLEPYLQPIVTLDERRPIGFELLMRLRDRHVDGTSIAECIQIAERTGLIHEVGEYMLRAAARMLTDHADELRGLVLNVNVSVRQLLHTQFVDDVVTIIGETGIDPSSICFEITESHWLDTKGPARDALGALRAMGFRLALDDFGTGYASLTYLRELEVDTVKVDRAFVQSVNVPGQGRDLCAVMLSMCRLYGLGVVAEGVETEAEASALRTIGFDAAQGYLFAKPMPVSTAMAWLGHEHSSAANAAAYS